MAGMDNEFVIHPCKMSQSRIEAIVEASGDFIDQMNTHINFFWNFHSNVYTLSIYFIALNESVGFVLIYRPHPVCSHFHICFPLSTFTHTLSIQTFQYYYHSFVKSLPMNKTISCLSIHINPLLIPLSLLSYILCSLYSSHSYIPQPTHLPIAV